MKALARLLKNTMVVLARIFRLRIVIGRIAKRRAFLGISLLSALFLGFVGGAAVIYFNVPAAEPLRNAFLGLDALARHGELPPLSDDPNGGEPGIARDDPARTFDGFTLVTSTQGSSAHLIDMQGEVVHQWKMPFHAVWPNPTHIKHPVIGEQVHWFRCRLFPDGELLAVYQADSDTPHGYGFVKLDRESRLLWSCADNVHHDFDIADDGTIYALSQHISREPIPEVRSIEPPYLTDDLLILSPDGRELQKISLLDALVRSPYCEMLLTVHTDSTGPHTTAAAPADASSTDPLEDQSHPLPPMVTERGDVLHANSVKLLKPSLASKFPLFKEGQILLSFCRINAIAVLDVPSRTIVWAARGIWAAQHDAEFLDNGHILLYDNLGLPQHTRVLEFDPVHLSYPWSSTHSSMKPFYAPHRGMKQPLPNGNMLIVDPNGDRLIELDRTNAPVWEYVYPPDPDYPNMPEHVTGAWRYSPAEVKFLNGISARR